MTFTAHKLTESEIADAMETYDTQIRPLIDELYNRTKELGFPALINILIANKSAENPETGETHREGLCRFTGWGTEDEPIELAVAHMVLSRFFDFDQLQLVLTQRPEVIHKYHRLINKFLNMGIARWSDACEIFTDEAISEMLNNLDPSTNLH